MDQHDKVAVENFLSIMADRVRCGALLSSMPVSAGHTLAIIDWLRHQLMVEPNIKENENPPDYFLARLTDQKRKELEEDLTSLTPEERELVVNVLWHHVALTPLEALWHLRAGGM